MPQVGASQTRVLTRGHSNKLWKLSSESEIEEEKRSHELNQNLTKHYKPSETSRNRTRTPEDTSKSVSVIEGSPKYLKCNINKQKNPQLVT